MSTTAVIGGTGNIGSRLVGRLAARGAQVRAISRSPEAGADGIQTHAADLTDPAQAETALAGASAVYLTPPLGGDDPLGVETAVCHNVIEAARTTGVEHVVMHTALRGDRGDTGARVLDNKAPIEKELAESGVGYTIIRPSWFFQNLWAARDYLEQGVVSLPWPGDMVWAGVDVEDIVTVADAFLQRGPANRGFDLLAPGGVTGNAIAAATSRVLGREVAYQEAPVSSREYVEAFPIADAHKDLYAELFDYFKSETYIEDPQPVIDELDGFQPREIDDFLRDELFAGS